MLIDWFTVGAQALNFLVLVWLLKRFLYKPILNAIDAREKRIVAEIADADSQKADAKKEREEFEQKNAEFAKEREALLSKAAEDAKNECDKLLAQARQVADDLGARRKEALVREAENLGKTLVQKVQQEVFAIARKALGDLASIGLEARMAGVFIERLRSLDDSSKNSLAEAIKTATDSGIIRSAVDLDEAVRADLQKAMNETFAREVRIRFETAPDLVAGLEFSVNGQKVAWSIKEYLSALESDFKGVVDGKTA